MSKMKFALVAALPLLWSAAALAQTAPADQPAGPPEMHRTFDRAAWHKEHCVDHYAHLAGGLAFLEAKLNLTDAQRPAWDAWKKARLDDAAKTRETCVATVPQGDARPTLLEGEARMEKALSDRLSGLQARRPLLEALYKQLTPDQQKVFDRMGMSDREHGHFMWRHGMGGPGGGMPFGRD